MPIIDSSVFVKYVTREEGWEEAERHLALPTTLPLAMKETANALMTKALDGSITPNSAREILAKLAGMVKLLDQEELLDDSFRIAVEHHITVYDALFVAAAIHSKDALVTCDGRQSRVARELGAKVVSLA